MKYRIDSDLKPLLPFKFKKHSTLTRHLMNAFFKASFELTKPKSPFNRKHLTIQSRDREKITCYHYYKDHYEHKNMLIYLHGGGFQTEGSSFHQNMILKFAKRANLQILYVKYRLLPKYRYPKAFEDVVAAYQYLMTQTETFKFPSLFVGGDSAGGNLAFALALYDRDQGHHLIHKTMLICPVLTKHTHFLSHNMYQLTPMWNQHLNQDMWQQYLATSEDDIYASLLEKDVNDLSAIYIETAEFDPLRDEGIALEKKLKQANIKVIAHHTKKTVHGYDALPHATITKAMMQQRIHFLKGES
ncbi:MAG: alpha/beta hydrolase [Acholeplasmataceae bacterium]